MREFLLVLGVVTLYASAEGQTQTAQELWPELDVFWKPSVNTRLQFVASSTRDQDTSYYDHAAGIYLSIYVPRFAPVLFRRIADPDDSRVQRLALRVGYLYNHSFRQIPVITEQRPFVDGTLRWALPYSTLATNRSRFEFRVKNGVYSWRYRNEFKLERSYEIRRQALIPYVSAEAFYDSSPAAWNRFRFRAGTLIPLGNYVEVDGYFARQITEYLPVRDTNATGLTLNIYTNSPNRGRGK